MNDDQQDTTGHNWFQTAVQDWNNEINVVVKKFLSRDYLLSEAKGG